MPTLPSIDIIFKSLASSVVSRSARGTAILIISSTKMLSGYLEYRDLSEVSVEKLSEKGFDETVATDIYNDIAKVFKSEIDKLIVYVEQSNSSLGERVLPDILINHNPCWIYTANSEWQTELVTWVKAKEKESKYYKALTFGESAPDCKHIVNVGNTGKIYFENNEKEYSISECGPILLGMLTSANVKKGVTRAIVPGLTKVVEETLSEEVAVTSGKLLLVNTRNGVKISVGINSSMTSDPDDLRYIENVEVCDMINDDVAKVFEDEYLGKMKNSLDNQMLFISAVNGYFRELAAEGILDKEHENKADVDISAQRNAWISSGVSEARSWNDSVVRTKTFKRSVFLAGDVKILGTIDTLKFGISLN